MSIVGPLNFFIATASICCKSLIGCCRAVAPFGTAWLMKVVNVSTSEGTPSSPKETTGWRVSKWIGNGGGHLESP